MTAPCRRDETGNLMVELLVLAPVLFVLALAMVAFGRVTVARQQVVAAARAGAESATIAAGPADAEWAASAAAVTGYVGRAHTCRHASIKTDVSHFYPGGYVVVSVTCTVELADLSVPGIPGSTTVRASVTAPIDPYRSVL